MKREILMAFLVFLVSVSSFTDARAQGPRPPGMLRERACLPMEEIGLTDAQRASLERVNAEYASLIPRLRDDLMGRRMELERLLRDPKASEDDIRKKAKETVNAQNLLQERMLEYQLRIRAVLTPEQLSRWCILMGPGHGRGRWGMPWR